MEITMTNRETNTREVTLFISAEACSQLEQITGRRAPTSGAVDDIAWIRLIRQGDTSLVEIEGLTYTVETDNSGPGGGECITGIRFVGAYPLVFPPRA